jgi:hypothetical protein
MEIHLRILICAAIYASKMRAFAYFNCKKYEALKNTAFLSLVSLGFHSVFGNKVVKNTNINSSFDEA